MDLRLDGKTAVICGASGGVGAAAARILARAGANVVVASRNAGRLAEVAAQVRTEGGSARDLVVDLSDWSQTQQLAQAVEQAGPVDILVVTAGTLDPVGRTWQVDPAEWAENVQVNLTGTFNAVRAFLPGMVARRAGTVILVSSVAVKVGTPTWGAYGSAKAGVDFLGRVLQAELDMDEVPVRVHVAYPGVVDTPMQEKLRAMSSEQFPSVEAFRRMKEKGRLRAPEQPANLIWWLTTEAAADLKGQIADLDDPAIRERVAADLGIPVF